MISRIVYRAALFLALGFASTLLADEPAVVNLYSQRHYEADTKLYAQFTEQTGIKVNVVKGDDDGLFERLRLEGKNSPADLFFTVDAGRLHRAREAGLLQPVQSEVLNANIPAHLRDPEGHWFGLTTRARVIVYHKGKVKPTQLSTYEALTAPEWRGKVLIRSSTNVYNQSLMASMIVAKGEDTATLWAAGLVANLARAPKGSDRDQMKAIAAGEGELAVVNTYYLGLLLNSSNAEERQVGEMLGVCFPNQQDRGTHINVSGAGVTASSKNRANAIKLLEFLSGAEAQKVYSEANYEYPANPAVAWAPLLKGWGEFKADTTNMALLGKHNRQAVVLMDQAGWR